jgi:hypothetical protein
LGYRAPQQRSVGFEGTRLAPGMGLRCTAPAVTPTRPQFLHKREADTKAFRHLALRRFVGLQRVEHAFTQIWGVWLHTL